MKWKEWTGEYVWRDDDQDNREKRLETHVVHGEVRRAGEQQRVRKLAAIERDDCCQTGNLANFGRSMV